MDRETSKRCASCEFFQNRSIGPVARGTCHLKGPAMIGQFHILSQITVGYDPTTAVWPLVMADDWCAEFVADLHREGN
jgi:hypothetical protein